MRIRRRENWEAHNKSYAPFRIRVEKDLTTVSPYDLFYNSQAQPGSPAPLDSAAQDVIVER